MQNWSPMDTWIKYTGGPAPLTPHNTVLYPDNLLPKKGSRSAASNASTLHVWSSVLQTLNLPKTRRRCPRTEALSLLTPSCQVTQGGPSTILKTAPTHQRKLMLSEESPWPTVGNHPKFITGQTEVPTREAGSQAKQTLAEHPRSVGVPCMLALLHSFHPQEARAWEPPPL